MLVYATVCIGWDRCDHPWLQVHQARTGRDALSEIMYLDEYSILLRQVRKRNSSIWKKI